MEYDDDHFNFDMVMNVPHYSNIKKENVDPNAKSESQKNNEKTNPTNRKLGRKGKKLILRKKKEIKKLGEKKRVKVEGENNDTKIYECHHPLCEKVFYDRNSYRKHLITHGEKQVYIT